MRRRPIVLLVVVLVAVVIGTQVGWRFVLAPMLGLAIWSWATASMRSMANHGTSGTAASDEPEVVIDRPERTMYWCEECGTEVLLLVRGSGVAPRHCATRMHERAELVRDPESMN
jgi:DNA-directed RNA polymerase subunit RPC12/RpoP